MTFCLSLRQWGSERKGDFASTPCSATRGVGTSSSLMTKRWTDSGGRGASIQSVQGNPAGNRNPFLPAPAENPARVQRSFPFQVPVQIHFVVTKMAKRFNSVYYPLNINYTIVMFRRSCGANVHTMSLEGAGRVFPKAELCHSATPKPLAAEVAVGAGPALGNQEPCWPALGRRVLLTECVTLHSSKSGQATQTGHPESGMTEQESSRQRGVWSQERVSSATNESSVTGVCPSRVGSIRWGS